jgi:CubicO group peptidase (beta-lactamase class C family)
MRREVFAPLGMNDSGIDDDSPIGGHVALGHVEDGVMRLKAAPVIHYSALTGNGSAYSTVDDERRWLDGFWNDRLLSAADRQMMLAWDDGYGWYKSGQQSLARFKETIYYMTGELPGFASVIINLPRLRAEIVVLSNFKIPLPTPIGLDIAAMLEGGEYQRLGLRASPLTADEMYHVTGSFTFGPDFYRKNATLQLVAGADGLTLKWPGGPDGPVVDSPVLVIDDHHFIDRHYWTRFSVTDGPDGHPSQLTFGRFVGQRATGSPPAPSN